MLQWQPGLCAHSLSPTKTAGSFLQLVYIRTRCQAKVGDEGATAAHCMAALLTWPSPMPAKFATASYVLLLPQPEMVRGVQRDHRMAALLMCAQWSCASTSDAAQRATHPGCSSSATC